MGFANQQLSENRAKYTVNPLSTGAKREMVR